MEFTPVRNQSQLNQECPTQKMTQVQEAAHFLEAVLADLDKNIDVLGSRLTSVRCPKPQTVSGCSKDNPAPKAPIAEFIEGCAKRAQNMIGKINYFVDELEI